eukprot:TRINITY_DN9755_c0_g1_i2.p1 TRINITY_DN9755_c0_g1~~TRINITY_DN9755_c0_g1_i2.p1  ORF type:complete len:216 (+),score=22.06 TRINITY_DN9755_c0_g1_i2:150-797(+)
MMMTLTSNRNNKPDLLMNVRMSKRKTLRLSGYEGCQIDWDDPEWETNALVNASLGSFNQTGTKSAEELVSPEKLAKLYKKQKVLESRMKGFSRDRKSNASANAARRKSSRQKNLVKSAKKPKTKCRYKDVPLTRSSSDSLIKPKQNAKSPEPASEHRVVMLGDTKQSQSLLLKRKLTNRVSRCKRKCRKKSAASALPERRAKKRKSDLRKTHTKN